MKVWVITTGYVPARIFRRSIESFYWTISKELDMAHVCVDNHYPLNREANSQELRKICDLYGIKVLTPEKNLGLHEGFNWAISQLPIQDEDIIIGYDGDSCPIHKGWDKALVTPLEDWRIVWSSLMNLRTESDLQRVGFINHRVRKVRCFIVKNAVTNSICAWSAKFLREVGGLSELLPLYGHLEASMFPKLKGLRKEWVVLPDFTEVDAFRDQHDPEYMRWKWYYAHTKTWTTSFEDYVAAGCPILDPVPDRLP